jgi:hypothetical protein
MIDMDWRTTWRDLPSIFLIQHDFDYLPRFFSVSESGVERSDYADQPHLTRALRRFIGHTPARIVRERAG